MPKKKQIKKKLNKKRLPDQQEQILLVIFIALLALVVVLGIIVLNKNLKEKDKIKSNLVIPIIEKQTINEFSVDISNMKKDEEQEYIFKVTNYKENKVNAEELSYNISVNKYPNTTIELYKDEASKNLFTTNDLNEILTTTLEKDKKDNDVYRLVIRINKETSKDARVSVKIES